MSNEWGCEHPCACQCVVDLWAENERLRAAANTRARALAWVFDRLTTDGLTDKEIRSTARECEMVLLGADCAAISHAPDDWHDSHSALKAALSPQPEGQDND